MISTAPISAVIATRDREASLSRTLDSLSKQILLPAELIVVDASENDRTKAVLAEFEARVRPNTSVRWVAADIAGAAPQRNQGVALSTQPFIWFFDDDILFEPHCAECLWKTIESDRSLGGVNAMIVNQQYGKPGFTSRIMFTLMNGRREKSFAGKVIGPAVNLLPEDREDLPEIVPVEWLNTTCTIYRREALPNSPFDPFFNGYSLMEDLALSLRVGKKWGLANARKARIRHESQSSSHKKNVGELAKMELINRHYVMTKILNRSSVGDYLRFAAWEIFSIVSGAFQPEGIRNLPRVVSGKFSAVNNARRVIES
jgi:glycosyltransferase involved in cell wall biosynthesis